MGDTILVFAFVGIVSIVCLVVITIVDILVKNICTTQTELKAEIKELDFKVAYLQESDRELRNEVYRIRRGDK